MALPKLNPKVHHKIVATLQAGAFQTTAAQNAGITPKTFWAWLERGAMEEARVEEGFEPNAEEAKYVRFKKDVEIARACAEVEAVTNVRDAGRNGTWQASAWFLERSFPQRWSRNRELEEIKNDNEQANPDEVMSKLLNRLESLAERQHES